MNKFKYLLAAAIVSVSLASCDDDDDYPNIGTLEGIGMVERSASVGEGDFIRPLRNKQISVVYNNLVGLDPSKTVTLNGNTVTPFINPLNGMEILIPVDLVDNEDYVLEIPEGTVYRADDKSLVAPAKKVNFSTKIGVDKSLVATQLTNPNATQEAKDLYAYLLSNYGTKTLSGAMGEVAWGTGFVDYISANTGHTPKVVGFDYIHLAESYSSSWIDYADITPVQRVHDAGSIVTMTWHWMTPGSTDGNLWAQFDDDGNSEFLEVGNWANSIQIKPEFFSFAEENDSIVVYIANPEADAQGSFKNGSTWNGLTEKIVKEDGTEETVNYEYFDLCEKDEDGNITKRPSTIVLKLTGDLLAEVKRDGVIVSGKNYIITNVSYTGELGADIDGKMHYNNDFNPEKALIAGTPQNAILEADVAKVAYYLRELQDANIPVLFRPFHEAAGDYTNGPWFWWGNKGVKVTKDLWIWLYDKLTNKYGLNNLIWVWTMQTSDGGQLADVSKLKEAYPGDAYVDIVGADLYEDALSNQTKKFDLVNAAVDRKKIVALCECGNLLSVDEAFTDNAMWSYFMSWYDHDPADDGNMTFGFYGWNNDFKLSDGTKTNPWKVVLNNPLIINTNTAE